MATAFPWPLSYLDSSDRASTLVDFVYALATAAAPVLLGQLVQAAALQVGADDPDTRQAARTIRSLSVATLDELRTMVTLLRASGGHATELAPQPTLADLRTLVESSGIDAELTGELPPTVGTPAERALYRTVQEALTNVRKHAPQGAMQSN